MWWPDDPASQHFQICVPRSRTSRFDGGPPWKKNAEQKSRTWYSERGHGPSTRAKPQRSRVCAAGAGHVIPHVPTQRSSVPAPSSSRSSSFHCSVGLLRKHTLQQHNPPPQSTQPVRQRGLDLSAQRSTSWASHLINSEKTTSNSRTLCLNISSIVCAIVCGLNRVSSLFSSCVFRAVGGHTRTARLNFQRRHQHGAVTRMADSDPGSNSEQVKK